MWVAFFAGKCPTGVGYNDPDLGRGWQCKSIQLICRAFQWAFK